MSRLQVRFPQGVLMGGEENMGTGGSAIGGVFSVLFGIVWLGIVIYMISLAIRFVRAVEKIADKVK